MARRNLAGYADVKQIFDSALASGGGKYRLVTPGAAVHWRQRAYTFRKYYRETYPDDGRYEQLTMRIEDTTIILEPVRVVGTFIPAEGTPLPIPDDTSEMSAADKELFDIARRVKGDDVV